MRGWCFRVDTNAAVQALVGTSWVLTAREDPEGALAQVFPGDRIRFGPVEMVCLTAAGEEVARRYYEPGVRVGALTSVLSSLRVHNINPDRTTTVDLGTYRTDDMLNLTALSMSDGRSVTRSEKREFTGARPRLRYRLEENGRK